MTYIFGYCIIFVEFCRKTENYTTVDINKIIGTVISSAFAKIISSIISAIIAVNIAKGNKNFTLQEFLLNV